jgi:hypothetical protein
MMFGVGPWTGGTGVGRQAGKADRQTGKQADRQEATEPEGT